MSDGLTLTWQNLTSEVPPAALQHSQQLDNWVEQCFAGRRYEPFALWLDSAANEHSDSRYHVLLRRPQFVLSADDYTTRIEVMRRQLAMPGALDAEDERPLLKLAADLLQHLQQQIVTPPQSELPFCGGFAGILGYDLGRQTEALPCENDPDEYQTATACLGFYTEAIVVDKQTRTLWVLAPGRQHQQWLHSWLESAPPGDDKFELTSRWQSNMTESQYQQKFNQVKAYLRAGDTYQINLAQRFSANYKGDEWQAYQKLRRLNQAPFSAFMRLPDSCLLSVSPERFLAVDKTGKVQTKPIKGTRPRSANPEQDQYQRQRLLESEKDHAENLMIVDLLRNDLSRSCRPGTIDVPKLFAIESFPAVHHLVSTVTGQLQSAAGALDLMRRAFPGGSITGAPKIRAMEIIEELEPHRRSVYCGSIAYFSLDGSSDSSITIRTLLAEQGRLFCWAGGGLVIDSECAAEYQETLDKVAHILPLLESL
ncbi:aminodeoxychorismate synthase component I [Idiomarina seosinensis]|uniref:aminodeoxychorismate synthase component I n=1 Tax=Idiomarina seosinensis TaxID=281739 RepID=UPI00384EAB27